VGLALSSYTNSFAAYQNFQTNLSTYGVEEVHGFGNSADGFHDVTFFLGNNNANPVDAALRYVATSTNFGVPISGVNSTTNGNFFGFGVGTGNTKWVGFPDGSATIVFANPTHAFGFWITGVEAAAFGTSISVTGIDVDGTVFGILPQLNAAGGASFFGLWDTSPFFAIAISSASFGDAWGIDNVSFEIAQTPIPAALPLFATGLGALGLLGWRRKRKALAA